MEDYTYDLDRTASGPRCPHARGLPVDRGRPPRCEIHPLSIGGKADPVRLVFDARARAGARRRHHRPGRPLPDRRQRGRLVEPPDALPRLPVARAVWRPRPDFRTALEAWLPPAGRTTRSSPALGPEPLADFAEMAGIELLLIDETSTLRGFRKEIRWNQAYYHLARGL